jgi:hypothetical protein
MEQKEQDCFASCLATPRSDVATNSNVIRCNGSAPRQNGNVTQEQMKHCRREESGLQLINIFSLINTLKK